MAAADLLTAVSQVAMSKYRSVDVGNTLFGKVKLDPACIACDRPFGPASQVERCQLVWCEAPYSTPPSSGVCVCVRDGCRAAGYLFLRVF